MSHALDPRFALSAAQVPDLLLPGAPVRWAGGPLLPRTVTHVRGDKAVLCAGLFDLFGLTRNEESIVGLADLVLDLTQPLGATVAYRWLLSRKKAQPWMLWMTSPLDVTISLRVLRASVMEVVAGRPPVLGVQQAWSTSSVPSIQERILVPGLFADPDAGLYAKVAMNPKQFGFGWEVRQFDGFIQTLDAGPEGGAEGQACADASLLARGQALLFSDGTIRCPGEDPPVAALGEPLSASAPRR